ncbi:hypothetical protein [Bacillus sp. 1NLA3E]|uniref:hypothetical protein n=1 Tax=Bacillus sp. 1NLA3E TaxID=666686 RepID=UPI000247E489|nr:hypothetical protein [Bacillus sp. 1NLA3E]
MVKACIVCGANTRKVIKTGYELVHSDSKDPFTQAILAKYGKPPLGIGAICNTCLTKLARKQTYLIDALFSPLMESKM